MIRIAVSAQHEADNTALADYMPDLHKTSSITRDQYMDLVLMMRWNLECQMQ